MSFRTLSPRMKVALVVTIVVLAILSIPVYELGTIIVPWRLEHWRRCHGHARFDAREWKDSTLAEGPPAIRECMVDDLLFRFPLDGKSRAEVVALLGQPKPTSYFRDDDLVYWLGPERDLIAIDSEWLVVKLDKSGRVALARLATD